MTQESSIWLPVAIAFVAANLPWLSNRIFFVIRLKQSNKAAVWRWLEWFVLYFIAGAIALGFEQKVTGSIYQKGWEFYTVTFCLFMVFALPGFLYRYDVRRHIERA